MDERSAKIVKEWPWLLDLLPLAREVERDFYVDSNNPPVRRIDRRTAVVESGWGATTYLVAKDGTILASPSPKSDYNFGMTWRKLLPAILQLENPDDVAYIVKVIRLGKSFSSLSRATYTFQVLKMPKDETPTAFAQGVLSGWQEDERAKDERHAKIHEQHDHELEREVLKMVRD